MENTVSVGRIRQIDAVAGKLPFAGRAHSAHTDHSLHGTRRLYLELPSNLYAYQRHFRQRILHFYKRK